MSADTQAAVARLREHASRESSWPYAGVEVNPADLALLLAERDALAATVAQVEAVLADGNRFTGEVYIADVRDALALAREEAP